MGKLEYGKSYVRFLFIFVGVVVLANALFGKTVAGIVVSLSFFYMGVIQFYSGATLSRMLIALPTKERYPFAFYAVVMLWCVFGIFLLIGSLLTR